MSAIGHRVLSWRIKVKPKNKKYPKQKRVIIWNDISRYPSPSQEASCHMTAVIFNNTVVTVARNVCGEATHDHGASRCQQLFWQRFWTSLCKFGVVIVNVHTTAGLDGNNSFLSKFGWTRCKTYHWWNQLTLVYISRGHRNHTVLQVP